MSSTPITQIVSVPPTAPVPARPPRRMLGFVRSKWAAFAIRRLIALAATFLILVVLSFLIVQLIPGDPAIAIAGPNASAEDIARLEAQLGLDQPFWQRFLDYAAGVFTGHLGTSFMYGIPVETIIANRLPFTLALAGASIVVSLLVAVPLGLAIGVATRGGRRGWLDTGFGGATGFIDSVPGYIVATGLVVLFGIGVGLAPLLPPTYSARMPVASYVMPVIALSIGPVCTLARVVRRDVGVVLGQDFMRTARGWRLPAANRYIGWALPNILTTTLTLSGLILTGMVGGAIIIETVFGIPGLGSGIIKAILDRDYPVIQGMVLVIGMIAATVNLIVDTALAAVDPRTLGGTDG